MVPLRNIRRFARKTLRQPLYAVSVAIKRLKAYFYYQVSDGKSSYPESVTLFLTHKCNLRCKMCGQWGESGVTKSMGDGYVDEKLSIIEIKKVIDDLARGRPNITLFGGEPLLYPYCIDVIKYIKMKGMHCLMITNGALVHTLAESIVKSGLDELNVSLDGGRKLHDEIRGVPGLFDNITSGLKAVRDLKKEKSLKKPLVNLQCTITEYNYEHLEQMTDVAEETGADSLTYHNLIFLSEELVKEQEEIDKNWNNSSEAWKGFISDPKIDPDILFKKITEIKRRKVRFAVDFYPNLSKKSLRDYYHNPSFMPVSSGYHPRCMSPWVVSYIFPDGEVRPCLNFSYSFGNVKESKFTDIWNGKKARDYRNFLRDEKTFPVCARCTELYRY